MPFANCHVCLSSDELPERRYPQRQRTKPQLSQDSLQKEDELSSEMSDEQDANFKPKGGPSDSEDEEPPLKRKKGGRKKQETTAKTAKTKKQTKAPHQAGRRGQALPPLSAKSPKKRRTDNKTKKDQLTQVF